MEDIVRAVALSTGIYWKPNKWTFLLLLAARFQREVAFRLSSNDSRFNKYLEVDLYKTGRFSYDTSSRQTTNINIYSLSPPLLSNWVIVCGNLLKLP